MDLKIYKILYSPNFLKSLQIFEAYYVCICLDFNKIKENIFKSIKKLSYFPNKHPIYKDNLHKVIIGNFYVLYEVLEEESIIKIINIYNYKYNKILN